MSTLRPSGPPEASIEALLPVTEDWAIGVIAKLRDDAQAKLDKDRHAIVDFLQAHEMPEGLIEAWGLSAACRAPWVLRPAQDMARESGLGRALAVALLDWAGTDDSTAISLYLIEHGKLPPFRHNLRSRSAILHLPLSSSARSRHEAVFHHMVSEAILHGATPEEVQALDTADGFRQEVARRSAQGNHLLVDVHALGRLTALAVVSLFPEGHGPTVAEGREWHLVTAYPCENFRECLFGNPVPPWEPITDLIFPTDSLIPMEASFYLPRGAAPLDFSPFAPFLVSGDCEDLCSS